MIYSTITLLLFVLIILLLLLLFIDKYFNDYSIIKILLFNV